MPAIYAIEKFLNLKIRFKLAKSLYFVLVLIKNNEQSFFVSKKLLKSLTDIVNFKKLVVKYPLFLTQFNSAIGLKEFCEKEFTTFAKIRFISFDIFKFYKKLNLIFKFFAATIYKNLEILLSSIKFLFSLKF